MVFSDAAPAAEEALPPAPPVPGEAVEVAAGEDGTSPPPSEGVVLLDPEELYRAARADYGRGDYGLAVEGFDSAALDAAKKEIASDLR